MRERYEDELNRQYNTYNLTCRREQTSRDQELVKLSPTDKEAIARIHEAYDKKIRRAEHIYERYKEQAWKRYQKEAEELRLKYGDLPLKQKIGATSASQAELGGDKMARFCKFDETPSWPCRWEGEPTAEDCINCQLFVIKNTLYRLLRRYDDVHEISSRKGD